MRPGDTIIAVSSGPGRSPVGIVRASGPACAVLLARFVTLAPKLTADPPRADAAPPSPPAAQPPPGRCDEGFFLLPRQYDPSAPSASLALPDPLPVPVRVLRFFSPRSFTGEDAFELLLPGHPSLLDRAAHALTDRPGVRPARPGEFAARAYLAGKLTLAQAEGVAALIAATGRADLAAARRTLSGQAGAAAAAWADRLASMLALVEAGVDFSDQEDVTPISAAQLDRGVREIVGALQAAAGPGAVTRAPDWRPRIVIIGPPNAGKSTLFNALLGRPRAIASPIAGTTRDALEEPVSFRSVRLGPVPPVILSLVDTAGLEAPTAALPDAASAAAQAASRRAIDLADILVLCDPLGRFNQPEFAACAPALTTPQGTAPTVVRVRTMADLPINDRPGTPPGPAPRSAPSSEPAPGPDPLPVCALDGFGLDQLKDRLADAAWMLASPAGPSGDSGLLPRHTRAAIAALADLRLALEHLGPQLRAPGAGRSAPPRHPELIAQLLRSALDHLGDITGHIDPDQIIGRIFATFCIGK